MPERKLWTEEQDKALKHLKDVRGLKKWSMIARFMQQEFSIEGRTGKQCRERYHNHLDQSIVSTEWTVEEQNELFRLHGELGNKWSLMALNLNGRSDNCIKNHFYSKLRKAARKLNRLVGQKLRTDSWQIRMNTLYKIIQISQSKFKTNCKYDQELVDRCINIKNQLYLLESVIDRRQKQPQEERNISRLILEINQLDSKLTKNRKAQPKLLTAELTFEKEQKVKIQTEQQPFYHMFKRVCEELICPALI